MSSETPLRRIFNEALDRTDPAERARYLDEACDGDPTLRERVEKLLRAHESAGEFLAHGSAPEQASLFASNDASSALSERPGDTIGRYKLLQQIGEGGCGVVYMAAQEEPVRRRVALKILKPGLDTRQVVARFEAERQALAMMDHPNIATVLDGGATAAGRPYFVMELVRGVKITTYCDQNSLTTRQRLHLFVHVCHAIQHAHQKGIIHRDLKPSNILVTLHDGVALPKVIDFGIAKATGPQRLTDKTLFTAFEQFIGTPAYMSPEQAEMSSLDVDTRSDIYALGVLLYELLTGKTPFDTRELLASGLDEMRRTIREREPERPSTRLSTMLESELTTTAKRRQTDPPRLLHIVRGDLDWIVMKCLEKDRTRRYDTASSLATDIERHLNDEAVMARPPTALYRFQKVVRRNKVAFAAAIVVASALLIGIGLSTWLLFRERAAHQRAEANEKRAETEATRSVQVAQFMKDMLKGVGPAVALGRDVTLLREILDQTAERIDADLIQHPEAQIELRLTLSETYWELGLFTEAETMARKAVERARQHYGQHHLVTAHALVDRGWALCALINLGEAERCLVTAANIQRSLLGENHPMVGNTLDKLSEVFRRQGRWAPAEQTSREAVAIKRRVPDDPTLPRSLNQLGFVLRSGREAPFREAIELGEKLLGGEHPEVAVSLSNLGWVLLFKREFAEAEAVLDRALAIQTKVLGPQHPDLAVTLQYVGHVRQLAGKPLEADGFYRRAVAIRSAAPTPYGNSVSGEHNPGVPYVRAATVAAKVATNLAEAVEWLRKGAEHDLPEACLRLGIVYADGVGVRKDDAEAVKWFRKGADLGGHFAEHLLGFMFANGRGVPKGEAEAARLYRNAIQVYRKRADSGNILAMNNLACVLAACPIAELRDGTNAVALAERAVAATDRKRPDYLSTLAAAYAEVGQFQRAIEVQKEAIRLSRSKLEQEARTARVKLYESGLPCREEKFPYPF